MSEFHATWAWVMIIGNAMAGVWALAAHWVPAVRVRAMWWFIGLAEAAIFVQVILGVIVVNRLGLEAAPKFHMFYGFVAIFTVGIIYSYRQQLEPWKYLLYGFGGLFLMGLGIRAMLVGALPTL